MCKCIWLYMALWLYMEVCMTVYRCMWLYMAVYVFIWLYMVVYDCMCLTSACIWLHVAACNSIWLCIAICRHTQPHTGMCTYTAIYRYNGPTVAPRNHSPKGSYLLCWKMPQSKS